MSAGCLGARADRVRGEDGPGDSVRTPSGLHNLAMWASAGASLARLLADAAPRVSAAGAGAARRLRFSTECEPRPEQVVRLNPVLQEAPFVLTKEQEYLITRGDSHKERKLKELLLKLYVRRQDEHNEFPPEVRLEDLLSMIDMSQSQLTKMLRYTRSRSSKRESAERKKAKRKQEPVKEHDKTEDSWMGYCLFRNAMLPRISKADMNHYYNTLSSMALSYGQRVVIDCSYDSHMDDFRIKNTAKQIIACTVFNRRDERPFSFHVCNLNPDSKLMYYLRKLNPGFETSAGVALHSTSYIDVFEKKDIVYLSPHTDNILEYNPNDIYILGGLVDQVQGMPISNKKAEEEQIRYAALPLDQHVTWKQGTKCLCIHQVFNILLVVKNTGDWGKALLGNVPHRKLKIDVE